MKQIEKVWEQLASQKVELSLVKDVKSLADEAEKFERMIMEDIMIELGKAQDAIQQAKKMASRGAANVRSLAGEASSKLQTIQRSVKELGISVSDLGISENDLDYLDNIEFIAVMYGDLVKDIATLEKAFPNY